MGNTVNTTKNNSISFTSPSNQYFRKILDTLDIPLLSTSANISGQVSCSHIDHITHYFKNIAKPKGEILGINKFSTKTTNKIFNFMTKFLKGENKTLNWEFVVDKFIFETKSKLYILFKQKYLWVNINSFKDLNYAKKVYKKI